MSGWLLRISAAIAAALAAGCAAPSGVVGHPPAAIRSEPWSFDQTPGRSLHTQHYTIYTTIADDEVQRGIADVLEAAHAQYMQLAPDVDVSQAPMKCYMFGLRSEWETHTKERAGTDAAVYLQISRGGYTDGDVFVSFFIGDVATYRVAAHEGWHQFVSRNFRQRIPPFLEEGLACLFESYTYDAGGARWEPDKNYTRLRGLREAIEDGRIQPLDELIGMHAGQIVGRSMNGIDAFYAQSWGLARFLLEGESGRYRPALQRMLADAAAGKLYPPAAGQAPGSTAWRPALAGPALEKYLGVSLSQLDAQYRAYIRRIAQAGYSGRRGLP